MYFKILLTFLFSFTTSICFSQNNNIGHPFIKNYTKNNHHAGIQNWDIGQSTNGTMLFANNGGLLTFDGLTWGIIKGKSFINRKVYVDSLLNIVFIGGQNVFGYYKKDRQGQLVFTHLSEMLQEEDKQFGDIWQIAKHNGIIYFKSSRKLFIYNGDTLKVLTTNTYFSYVGSINNRFIVFISQKGVFELVNDKLITLNENAKYKDEHVINILTIEDSINLVFTEKNGLLNFYNNSISKYKTSADDFLRKNRITSAIHIPHNQIAIGTQFGGILIIDYYGNIIEHFDTDTGLLSDYNRCLYLDKDKNLWAGQEKGIDFIALNEPFRWINQQEQLKGIGYTVKVYKNHLYFGTSTGLYYLNINDSTRYKKTSVIKVINSDGQVWGLDLVGDKLFMSHHDGVFNIVNGEAIKLQEAGIGAWNFTKIDNDTYVSGNYRGIALYRKKSNGNWVFDHQYEGYDFTTRNLQYYQGNLWINKPNKGIIKIKLSNDYQNIDTIIKYKLNIVKGAVLNRIVTVEDGLFALTKKGIYQYDTINDKFSSLENWNEYFDNPKMKLLYGDKNDGLFYLDDKSFGHVNNFKKGIIKVQDSPIEGPKDWFVGGFEYLYKYKNNLLLATEDGFIQYHYKDHKEDKLTLEFSNIISCNTNDSCQFLSVNPIRVKKVSISKFKSIKFQYKTPHYIPYNPIQYKYRLLDYEDSWSDWSITNNKEYNGLPIGSYTFEVMSKTEGSVEKSSIGHYSEISKFSFVVLPKWYLSNIAKWFYFLVFSTLIILLILFPKKKYKKEKEALESVHEKIMEEQEAVIIGHQEVIEEHIETIEQSEQKLTKIKTEKLQNDLKHKNKELMSITMHLSKKNEIINDLKEALETLSKKTTIPETTKTIKKMVRVINRQNDSDEDWSQFIIHFDQVHEGFVEKIKEAHDSLTPRDIRLCAYLSLNLNTKEIGPLLGISVRGVESSRYRLRKKLGLGKDINLINYLLRFQKK